MNAFLTVMGSNADQTVVEDLVAIVLTQQKVTRQCLFGEIFDKSCAGRCFDGQCYCDDNCDGIECGYNKCGRVLSQSNLLNCLF